MKATSYLPVIVIVLALTASAVAKNDKDKKKNKDESSSAAVAAGAAGAAVQPVPDTGRTAMLLGGGLIGIAGLGWKLGHRTRA